MMQKLKFKSLFRKTSVQLIGIIFPFLVLGIFLNWIGDVASVRKQETYTPKQYDTPKQALEFQQVEIKKVDIPIVFNQNSTNDEQFSAYVEFPKIRQSEKEKTEKTYNFTGLATVFIIMGLSLSFAVYYNQKNKGKSSFQIETIRK